MSVEWVISEGDVKLHLRYGKVSLEDILYSYGMDVKAGYIVDNRHETKIEDEISPDHFGYTHRSAFTGKVHCCPRYVGTARTDGKWKRFTENFVVA
jgi:hypothetical protein